MYDFHINLSVVFDNSPRVLETPFLRDDLRIEPDFNIRYMRHIIELVFHVLSWEGGGWVLPLAKGCQVTVTLACSTSLVNFFYFNY